MMTANHSKVTSPPPQEELTAQFVDHINKLTTLTTEEEAAILQSTPIETLEKGHLLIREGEIPNRCFFIIKGCVRQYYLRNGEEKTTFFYTEGQSIPISTGDANRAPSKHYLECIEETTLSHSTFEQEQEMYRRFPRFETLCRIELEKQLTLYQEILADFIMTTPEERYLNLLNNNPGLLYRVPQYQLASYIGVKPESLSRIRRRILQK
ncbi:MAG: Crp/Fnr family transcriptional regulator [Bacteroidota bacterium]